MFLCSLGPSNECLWHQSLKYNHISTSGIVNKFHFVGQLSYSGCLGLGGKQDFETAIDVCMGVGKELVCYAPHTRHLGLMHA
jgi:hypothetical protein